MTTGVLFVCTGNTCRSPLAAGVLRSLVRRAGLEQAFEIDSAGINIRQAGQPPSPLALEAAARRGYDIAGHCSRPLTVEDLAHFDHPLAMAGAHLTAMRALAPAARPRMFLAEDVADPYGGTAPGL
jgi:protein-tyrosine phosphatase